MVEEARPKLGYRPGARVVISMALSTWLRLDVARLDAANISAPRPEL